MHEMALFKSMDMKVYAGFMPLMMAIKSEGFDDEVSNGQVLRALHSSSDMVSPNGPCNLRTFCCYTADGGEARKALRIELRNKINPSLGVNIVLRPRSSTELEVVR